MFRAMSAQPSINHSPQPARSLRRRQLAYLEAMVKKMQLTRAEIARGANISPSTFSKFENDVENIAQLGSKVMEKLTAFTGVPFEGWQTHQPVQEFEPEAEIVSGELGNEYLSRAISALKASGNSVDAWVLRSLPLDLAGYLPGDILIVDNHVTPADGDIVCAQSYDRLGRAETIFRFYQKPFLTARSSQSLNFRPLIVDEDRVVIRGVVVSSLRPRSTH